MLDKNIDEIVNNFLSGVGQKKSNREKLNNTFKRFYDAMWITDKNRKIVCANSIIVKKLKCHSEDMISKDFLNFIFEEEKPEAVSIMHEPSSEKSLHSFRLRCFDGTEFNTKCYIKAYYNKGDYTGSIVVFRDNMEK